MEDVGTSPAATSPLQMFDISTVIRDSASLLSADEQQFDMVTPVGEFCFQSPPESI